MKNKKLVFVLILIFIIIITFFCIPKSKKIKIGNNNSNQEIIQNILNISSYETEIELEVNSNKNKNKYIIKQKYEYPDISEQEIIEPENIKGVKIVKNKNEVKVENTKLDIVKIYQNYEYMIDNCIDLNAFIEKYKKSDTQKYKENENEIILEIENENKKYEKYIALYVKKDTGKPVKMEIKDNSKKTLIYILYREVKLK